MNTLKITKEKKARWPAKASMFCTRRKCEITFTVPVFHKHRQITWNCYVDDPNASSSSYDLIMGMKAHAQGLVSISHYTIYIAGSCMSTLEVEQTSHKSKSLFLQKTAYPKTMASKVIFGCPELGGSGMLDLHIEQNILNLQLLERALSDKQMAGTINCCTQDVCIHV
jgi:hypothetical protein